METIIFKGHITNGIGKYIELHIPGHNEIIQAPCDWPESLQKGSLNVRIDVNGYPSSFADYGLSPTIRELDSKLFIPEFEIAQSEIGDNSLEPTDDMLERGKAQVWRASLRTTNESISCWVLRRLGSSLLDQLELLSQNHLRTAFNLYNGQDVEVHMQGHWKTRQE